MNRQLQLFAKLNSPYYVYAPDFTLASGGIRAMHYLCHALNLAGEEAYVTTDKVSPGLRTPTLTLKEVERHRAENREPIIVYPEVVSGNPANARHVVRYLLNVPGFLHQKGYTWGADDLIYAHGSCVVPAGMEADLLQLPLINTSIYNRDGVDDTERSGSLVFINRYLGRGGQLSPITEGCTEISFRVVRRTPEQLAALYRSAEFLYTYEPSTACFEAMLCGCPVVYLPNNVMLDMPPPSYLTDVGSAWGNSPEQIEHARRTIDRVPEVYEQVNQSFLRELEAFIDRTQARVRKIASAQAAQAAQAGLIPAKKRVILLSADPAGATAPLMRLIKPLGLAPDDWEVVSGLQDGQVKVDLTNPPQLIVLQRAIVGMFSLDALKQLFRLGIPIVYDTDARFDAQSEQFKASIDYVVQHAHAVIVANEQLADAYRAISSRVHVVPSQVVFELFEHPVRGAAPVVRIGVFSNSLEASNFAVLDKALRKIHDRYGNQVKFAFVGETSPAGWGAGRGARFVKVAPTLDERARQLHELELDIALVPLDNTAFNESGSTASYLEFSAAGMATIASARAAYGAAIQNGYDGLLANDTEQDWIDAIGKLIETPSLRRQLAHTAQAKVRRWHSLRELPASLEGALMSALGVEQPEPPSQTESASEIVRGVLVLDPEGCGEQIDRTFGYIDSTPYRALIRVVLTTQQDILPEWTTKLRYLKAANPREYEAAAAQLLALPTFDWALVTEAGTIQAGMQVQ
ncbi:glycosyltransferase [Paraburkholderia atlantica]|uniref:glycosyltransferase n=1 Tax=Paraburkholderia atlantica TaxID=2654982 RepID=UPI00160977B3|nr:glycosyltransferase [Paraburkholderia atlantica]MBB5506700.1 glycosyltransferase involved in cell wall biosynthesis [Paraburkholderia atlantica]